MSAEINSKYYETCEIEEGETGQFEIFKSGKSILSKKDHGDFFTLEDVKEKLEEMNDILKGNMEAHRNHQRVGKCNSCSRRKGCPERLKN